MPGPPFGAHLRLRREASQRRQNRRQNRSGASIWRSESLRVRFPDSASSQAHSFVLACIERPNSDRLSAHRYIYVRCTRTWVPALQSLRAVSKRGSYSGILYQERSRFRSRLTIWRTTPSDNGFSARCNGRKRDVCQVGESSRNELAGLGRGRLLWDDGNDR
jgi:hypothetical protein